MGPIGWAVCLHRGRIRSRAVRAAIALGSNLGDRRRWLELALSLLDLPVLQVSRIYDTEPVGPIAQGRFLNAVAVVDTFPDPWGLLARMLAVERALGRRRLVAKGPRTVDLDLLLMAEEVEPDPRVTLPHPEIGRRPFVLIPLLEVWPRDEVPLSEEVVARCLEDAPSLCPVSAADWFPRSGRN